MNDRVCKWSYNKTNLISEAAQVLQAPRTASNRNSHERTEMATDNHTSLTIKLLLNKGYTTLLDPIDADLGVYGWTAAVKPSGVIYAVRNQKIDKNEWKAIRIHRVILERVLGLVLSSEQEVDHINGDGLDNRRENLRLATRKENSRNTSVFSSNTSGARGVSWNKDKKKWAAYIKVDNQLIRLGRFKELEDAVKARTDAEIKYYGEFSPTLSRGKI